MSKTHSPCRVSALAGAGAAAAVGLSVCGGLAALGFIAGPAPGGSAPPQTRGPSSGSAHLRAEEASSPSMSSAWAGASLALALIGLGAHRTARGREAQPSTTAVARCAAKSAAALDLTTQLGVCPPLGYWDPLGLAKYDDPAIAAAQFKRRRVVELQHGRVSMFACIGYIVPYYFKWPGYLSPSQGLSFEDMPNGLAAMSKIPGLGWLQILAFVGYIEVTNLQSPPKEYAGDYEGYGAFGLPGGGGIADKEKKEKSLLAEINNGRLAMVAIIGMFYQDGLTGEAWGDWANYADSPLRAFESELGVQPPVGFWDPAGFCKDGDAEAFKRRRETEIKHGRVSMIAATGYIVPEYFRWPGDCSPSIGLQFADVPNGLAALSKIPAIGWAQMFLFCGLVDFGYFQADPSRDPGDYANAGVFGVPNQGASMQDSETRKKKLNAELANGRLAMMAIIGMFFQDGLTGGAWGDWESYVDSPLRASETELGV